jgi:O-antigen ligase
MKRFSSSSSRLTWLDKAVFVQVAVLLVGSAWAFGGNIWWARLALSIWASLALPLTLIAFLRKDTIGQEARARKTWLLPPLLYAGLVVASTFNPSFDPLVIDGVTLVAHKGAARPDWPSTVNAAASLGSLWLGAGVYLSALNLAWVLRSRAALRGLMILIAGNALALSVFGTVQALSSAGFYFGAATSPNLRYFATFIYNNHWGAFMILSLSVALGLLFYQVRRIHGRDLWHSPFSAALLGALLIAATAPISASRAATGMAALLLTIATVQALVTITRERRRRNRPVWPPVVALLLWVSAGIGAVGWLALDAITSRYTETRSALEKNQSLWGARLELYRDTWELARQKPVFGWGLDGYGVAFQLIRPPPLEANRQNERRYATAHNDWLQSIAETGFAGTTLLVAMVALPLATLPRRVRGHPLVAYPLSGLGLLLLYAIVEFPFSNPAFLVLFWTCLFMTVQYARLLPFDRASESTEGTS